MVIFIRNVSSKGRNSNSFCRVLYGRNISSKESNSFCRVIMEETLSAKDESTFLWRVYNMRKKLCRVYYGMTICTESTLKRVFAKSLRRNCSYFRRVSKERNTFSRASNGLNTFCTVYNFKKFFQMFCSSGDFKLFHIETINHLIRFHN